MRLKTFGVIAMLLISGAIPSWASRYEAQLPLLQGGSLGGYVVIVLVNRSPSALPAQVQINVQDKATNNVYTYTTKSVTVPGTTNNPVTGELATTGKMALTWDLQQAGFDQFARLTVDIQVPDAQNPPAVSWITTVTARQGSEVLFWADQRRFIKL
jgi:hypothetical protein